MKYFGIVEENLDDLERFIGPSLKDSFMKFYGFDDEKASRGIEKYREYFSVTGLFENEVYDGIRNLLEKLLVSNKKMIVATSKPTVFSLKILEHFDLAKYFMNITGSELDGRRGEKGEVISFALNECGITSLEKVVMIGDRKYDIIGAKENGIASIGVSYGFGSVKELKDEGCDYLVGSVIELGELFGI